MPLRLLGLFLAASAAVAAAPAKPAKPAAPPRATTTSPDDVTMLPRKDIFAPQPGPALGVFYQGDHASSGGFSQTVNSLGIAGMFRVNPLLLADAGLVFALNGANSGFDRFGAGATYFVQPNLGLLANAAVYRYTVGTVFGGTTSKAGFVLGGGANITYPLAPQVTFFTRRPWIVAPLGSGLPGGGAEWADDVLAIDFNDVQTNFMLGVPLGIYDALTPEIGVALRTALRHTFGDVASATYIPLFADVVVSVVKNAGSVKNVSLVGSFGLPGEIGGPFSYGDLLKWNIMLQGQM